MGVRATGPSSYIVHPQRDKKTRVSLHHWPGQAGGGSHFCGGHAARTHQPAANSAAEDQGSGGQDDHGGEEEGGGGRGRLHCLINEAINNRFLYFRKYINNKLKVFMLSNLLYLQKSQVF